MVMSRRADDPEASLPTASSSRTHDGHDDDDDHERTPLLERSGRRTASKAGNDGPWKIALFSAVILVLTWLVVFEGFRSPWPSLVPHRPLPKDPLARATALLEQYPLIDGHIDLPIQARARYSNHVEDINLWDSNLPGHVNIPKLRAGRVGGFFWSAYVQCPGEAHLNEGPHFVNATWRVRDTLEQIDVTKLLIRKHHDIFDFVTTANGIRGSFGNGKIAGLIGIEGAHSLGNSLAALRQYYDLGVRYSYQGKPIERRGLSPFGERLVREMNRIGMVIDLSHTSEETARDTLRTTRAPVIFSHSNAKGVYDVARNVPDDVLKSLNTHDAGIVMATFAPEFVSKHNATVKDVADHIDYLAKLAGHRNVGIGSDFDGILSTPDGLEDASKYPALMAELVKRGWSDKQIIGLAGENLLRTLERVEAVARQHAEVLPDTTIYDKRPDLPFHFK